MRVHILGDWFDTLGTLPCFELLDGHDVMVWTDYETHASAPAGRVLPAEAVVLIRDRSRIAAELLDR